MKWLLVDCKALSTKGKDIRDNEIILDEDNNLSLRGLKSEYFQGLLDLKHFVKYCPTETPEVM